MAADKTPAPILPSTRPSCKHGVIGYCTICVKSAVSDYDKHYAKPAPIPPEPVCLFNDGKCCAFDKTHCRQLGRCTASPPHAGQEPDAYTQTLMREPHRYTNRSPGTYEDHALIVALQAQHEADAARIAELVEDADTFYASYQDAVAQLTTAEAALAQAVALLRAYPRGYTPDWWRDVEDFLASAKADERSDGQASREGAK